MSQQNFQRPGNFERPEQPTPALGGPFVWASRHPLIGFLCVLLLLFASYVVGIFFHPAGLTPSQQSVAQATPTTGFAQSPDDLAHWTTIQVFKGKGSQTTSAFTIGSSWRIMWTCDIVSNQNNAYNFTIHVNTKTNGLLSGGVETMCDKNNLHSVVDMHQGGNVHLNVISKGTWEILVQRPAV